MKEKDYTPSLGKRTRRILEERKKILTPIASRAALLIRPHVGRQHVGEKELDDDSWRND